MVLCIIEREEVIQLLAMDPYRSVVNYSRFIKRAIDLMQKPSVIESPSGRVPEKVPRWDLMVQKVAAVEKCFRGCLWWFGHIWEYIGERIRPGGARGAHKGGDAPFPLGAPSILVAASLLPRLLQVSSLSSGPRKITEKVLFCLDSVWYSFFVKLKNREKQELALGSRLIGQSQKII